MKKFADRTDAGRQLARQLRDLGLQPAPVVLALPRGGVPVGAEVARALQAPLDVLVVRKLRVPKRPELAMGAVAGVGEQVETVRNEDVIARTGLSEEDVERARDAELVELHRREEALRRGRPGVSVVGRTAVLVDDGLATGATMSAAVRAVRRQQPAQLVVAVPVGASEPCASLQAQVDRLVCLRVPRDFSAVSLAYDDFRQTSDEQVQELLRALPA